MTTYDDVMAKFPEIAKAIAHFPSEATQLEAMRVAVRALLLGMTDQGRSASKRTSSKASAEMAEDPLDDLFEPSSARKSTVARRPPRSSVKSAVTDLIGSGFFAEAKGVGVVSEQLRTQRGLAFGSNKVAMTLLRLVRDGLLERSKTDKGDFVYAAK